MGLSCFYVGTQTGHTYPDVRISCAILTTMIVLSGLLCPTILYSQQDVTSNQERALSGYTTTKEKPLSDFFDVRFGTIPDPFTDKPAKVIELNHDDNGRQKVIVCSDFYSLSFKSSGIQWRKLGGGDLYHLYKLGDDLGNGRVTDDCITHYTGIHGVIVQDRDINVDLDGGSIFNSDVNDVAFTGSTKGDPRAARTTKMLSITPSSSGRFVLTETLDSNAPEITQLVVREGESSSYYLRLSTEPTNSLGALVVGIGVDAPVTISATAGELPEDGFIAITFCSATLYAAFPALCHLKWDAPLQITITPSEDFTGDFEIFHLPTILGGMGIYSEATLTLPVTVVPRPVVELAVFRNPVPEGSAFTITLVLSEEQTAPTMIPLAFANIDAEDGDYEVLESLTIPANAIVKTQELSANDDSDKDDEVFTIALDPDSDDWPPGLDAGNPSPIEVTIEDDDKLPTTVDLAASPNPVEEGEIVTITRSPRQRLRR